MPWNECKPMDERLRFIARLLEGEKMAPLGAGVAAGPRRTPLIRVFDAKITGLRVTERPLCTRNSQEFNTFCGSDPNAP